MASGVYKFLYVAGSGAMPSTIRVVVQPTRALQRETLARLLSYGVKAMIFPPDDGEYEETVPSGVLVAPEVTAYTSWQAFLSHYQARPNIDPAVFDDANQVLITSGCWPCIRFEYIDAEPSAEVVDKIHRGLYLPLPPIDLHRRKAPYSSRTGVREFSKELEEERGISFRKNEVVSWREF